MTQAIDLGLALTAVGFLIAWLLVVAWVDFGYPNHALTWSIAFVCFGSAWALALATLFSGPSLLLKLGLLALPAMGTGLTSFAFHQRAGNLKAARIVAIAIGVEILVAVLAYWATGSFGISSLPYSLLNIAACWYASSALTGRRKGERTAERLTILWLRGLALMFTALFVIRLIRTLRGYSDEPLVRLLDIAPLLPAILTGIGLAAILLLTADLADQTRRLAGTDMLTGLLNRRGFEDAAKALLGSAQRNQRDVSLAVIDIDRFKDVNDRFGHLAGDEVLRRFAACLTAHAGPRDILARIGGEEFAVMMADRDCDGSQVVLEGMRCAIAACPLDLPQDHRITASFGLASLEMAQDLPGLFSTADRALYRAKSAGRNRVIVAT